MRIIGGKYGGLRLSLKLPEGVRPTTDYSKEMIFNVLNHNFDFDGAKVLDIFAGTGGLGIETLSRGASHCTFVEKNRKVVELLQTTLEKVKIEKSQFTIKQNDYKKALKELEWEFHLVFADAPYLLKVSNEIYNHFAKQNLAEGGFLVIEYGSTERLILDDKLKLVTEKNLGETTISIFEKL